MTDKQVSAIKRALNWSLVDLDETERNQVRSLTEREDISTIDTHSLVGAMMDIAYLDAMRDENVEKRKEMAVKEVQSLIQKYND